MNVTLIEKADAVVNAPQWAPYFGWHDDHRHLDGTAGYLPAVQQVRAEFKELIEEALQNLA